MRGAGETHVITGASSGIGREIALQLAQPGRELWLVGRDAVRLEQVAEKVRSKGATAQACILDLADVERCGKWLDETFPADKPVDAVYLAAAVSMFGEVKDTYPEDWQRIYETNLLSPVQWSRFFYRSMVRFERGKIVLVSSLAAYSGYPTATAYATMKAGLLGLFRSLVHEGKMHGVDIHLACPGYVKTGIYRAAIFRETSYESTLRQIEATGFAMIESDEAARKILRKTSGRGSEFSFPAYGAALKWASPRFPFVLRMIHRKMMGRFRQEREDMA